MLQWCQQKPLFLRTSLAVQWLRLYTFTEGDTGSVPGWRTKIPHAKLHSQKNKYVNLRFLKWNALFRNKFHLFKKKKKRNILAAPYGKWDLNSPTRERTHTPCIGRQSLDHQGCPQEPLFLLLALVLNSGSCPAINSLTFKVLPYSFLL